MQFEDLFDDRVSQYETASTILEAEKDNRVFNKEPREWAGRFIRDLHIRYYQGVFYEYDKGAYRYLSEESLESRCAEFLSTCYTLNKKDTHIPFNVTRATIAETIAAVKNLRLLEGDSPCWLTKGPKDIVSFPNGLLHVPSGNFLPPSPDFFTLTSMNFDYNPDAPEPERWNAFLEQVLDGESRTTLMQYIGYLLSGDTSFQKILMIVGPPGSGKSTLLRAMGRVVGEENVAGTDIESLSDRFGLENLDGKTIAFLPDESFDYRTCKVGIDRLKRISGCDTVSIRRMRQKSLMAKLPIRFVVSTNEIPRLRGSAAAMARRFLILRTPPFTGDVDPRLTDKLVEEAPGILNQAIAALKELLKTREFIQPKSGEDDIDEILDLGSSVSMFVKECCKPDGEIETDVIFINYCGWSESNKEYQIDAREFGRQLRASLPHVKRRTRRNSGFRYRVYEGVSMMRDDTDEK